MLKLKAYTECRHEQQQCVSDKSSNSAWQAAADAERGRSARTRSDTNVTGSGKQKNRATFPFGHSVGRVGCRASKPDCGSVTKRSKICLESGRRRNL